MDEIVPGVLQHLREADILSRAGVAVAAQGREYCRTGAVHTTSRQGLRLSGIVEVPDISLTSLTPGATTISSIKTTDFNAPRHFPVTVEVQEAGRWSSACTCSPIAIGEGFTPLCVHAAALLYYWLAHPYAFATQASPTSSSPYMPASRLPATPARSPDVSPGAKRLSPISQVRPPLSPLSPLSSLSSFVSPTSTSTANSLAQLAINDLRNIAKEYELATNGVSKQELIETILDALKQPEIVRKMVATLEKTQRQFLATFTLAGGYMNDEELRGLNERFGLGSVEQLQQTLAKLQSKGLMLRTGLNSSMQSRSSNSTLDVNWYAPPEVRAALHIALPITPYYLEEQSVPPEVFYAEPYRLLADLLLVARVLEGQVMERESRKLEGRGSSGSLLRAAGLSTNEGSTAVPPPAGLPPTALLQTLQDALPYSPAFLRFAYRILRLGEILYMDGETQHSLHVTLHMLPNAAELLLGPTRAEVIVELFMHWLQQATYIELFELAEGALRLRCRATPLNQPALRIGELEAENQEARQRLIGLLSQAPAHQWISFPAFARFVYRLHPTFLQRRQRLFPTPHWWIEQEEGRQLHPAQWNDWQRAEGRYLAQIIQGPLHWWGASDIALSPDGQLQAFRLTSMASLLLQSMKTTVPATQSASEPVEISAYDMSGIELSARGEIFVVASTGNWPLIALIERFARIKGVQDGRLCYQITPPSLSEALRRGEDLTPFLDLLRCSVDVEKQDDTTDSTGSIALMLRQLEQRIANYGRIRLYTGVTLLEVADTLTLRELAATTSIDRQVIHSIRPTMMLLKQQGGEQLIDELKRRGQVPLLHEDD